MSTNNYFVVFIIAALILAVSGNLKSQEFEGTIYGSIVKNSVGFQDRVHLHQGPGMFFGSEQAGNNGNYAFQDIPFGEYFTILGPIEGLCFSWRTTKFNIDEDSTAICLDTLDCYSTKLIYPTDGSSLSPDDVDDDHPLIFRWTPYAGEYEKINQRAEYQIEIFSMNGKQHFKSPRIEETVYHFNGRFDDNSYLQNQPYQWRLSIYPKNSRWFGTSYVRDLLPGNLGEIQALNGEYLSLEIPRWYVSTVEEFDLIHFLDVAYQIEYDLSGAFLSKGQRGTIIYDPTINWAHSGLWVGFPIHFGKGWFRKGMVPWFGIMHEMGHDFQTGALQKAERSNRPPGHGNCHL